MVYFKAQWLSYVIIDAIFLFIGGKYLFTGCKTKRSAQWWYVMRYQIQGVLFRVKRNPYSYLEDITQLPLKEVTGDHTQGSPHGKDQQKWICLKSLKNPARKTMGWM